MHEKYGRIAQPLHDQILCRFGQKVQSQNCSLRSFGLSRIEAKALEKTALFQRCCQTPCPREKFNATEVIDCQAQRESLLVLPQGVWFATPFFATNMEALVAPLSRLCTSTSVLKIEIVAYRFARFAHMSVAE